MAVTILERPEGNILSSTANNGVSYETSTFFGIQYPSHGLVTGDIIYVVSTIEEYNGFKKVGAYIANEFAVVNLDGTNIDFLQIVDVTYYVSVLTHGWSAVHLPITYRLSNTLYPTNSADTTRNINSVQDANGYTVLQLSGSLGTVHSYDFISITVPNDTDLSGVYQILEYISDTVLLINLEYDSGNDFTGATAIKQYNNYNILVRVYAGINASHEWTAQKPYELAATIPYIPDVNNEVFFSIDEILKSYIETRNNLVLGTLPNNIDFWVNFYIETAEVYDDSDGYTFGTTTSSFTSDQSNFEGVAVNSKLDFKNVYSGYLSEYLMTNNQAKFLTLFTIPVLFACGDETPDCYSDISFLNPETSIAIISALRQEFYLNGNGPAVVDIPVDEEYGVIRMELEANCEYDRVDISLVGGVQLLDEPEFNATGDWLQTSTAAANWTISGGMASVLIAPTTSSELLYQNVPNVGGDYRVIANVSTTSGGADWQADVTVYFYVGGTGGTLVDFQLLGTVQGTGVGNVPTLAIDTQFNVSGAFDTIAIVIGGYAGPVSSVTVHVEDFYIASADSAMSPISNWSQHIAGSSVWTLGAEPTVTLAVPLAESYYLISPLTEIDSSYDIQYILTSLYLGSPATSPINYEIGFLDAAFLEVGTPVTGNFGLDAVVTAQVTVTPTNDTAYIYIKVDRIVGGDPDASYDVEVNLLSIPGLALSETKQFRIDCNCCPHEIRLSWLNNLGGMEPTWAFCGEKDVIREIQEAMTTKKNILPNWPKSYGADADTIKKQTLRVSNKAYTIRSQFLTEDEADALAFIKSSILVQIVNSRTDRRTVIVDTDSFIIRKDGDKTFEIAFNISFTDDISVQTL